jgi:hypothetical protein
MTFDPAHGYPKDLENEQEEIYHEKPGFTSLNSARAE